MDRDISSFLLEKATTELEGLIVLWAIVGLLKKLCMLTGISEEQMASDIKNLLQGGLELDFIEKKPTEPIIYGEEVVVKL